MKRYIIFAVVMLLGLNSCVVEDGTERRPGRERELLVNQVRGALANGIEYFPYAMYANAYFSSAEQAVILLKARYFADVTIEVKDNNLIFTAERDRYLLETDGRPLSEGGEWTLWRYWSSNENPSRYMTYTGVEGEENCFKACYAGINYSPEKYSVDAEVVYDIDVEKSYIEARVGGSGMIEDEGSFLTEFSIDEERPLVSSLRWNHYTGGELNITYTDLVTEKRKLVSVTFLNSGEYRFN